MEIKVLSYRFMFNNYVNCYLIKTDESYFMVDTGMPNKRKVIEQAIESAGCIPGNLKLIILTHGDLDHAGNAVYFRKRFSARIAMHTDDVGMVEHGDMFASRKKPHVIVKAIANRFFGLKESDRFIPDITIKDGVDLAEFGWDARVMHLPGHTRGSIEILNADGSLFCGDLLSNITKPALFSIMDDVPEAKTSIRKLRSLNIKTVYPGHGRPFPLGSLLE